MKIIIHHMLSCLGIMLFLLSLQTLALHTYADNNFVVNRNGSVTVDGIKYYQYMSVKMRYSYYLLPPCVILYTILAKFTSWIKKIGIVLGVVSIIFFSFFRSTSEKSWTSDGRVRFKTKYKEGFSPKLSPYKPRKSDSEYGEIPNFE